MARWFDRTFALGLPVAEAPALLERLRRTPDRLAGALAGQPAPLLIHRPDARWSMQEHAGHLLDLEALWDRRLDDFDAGAEALHPADLENQQTWQARHNERQPSELLAAFHDARGRILARLARMTEPQLARVALHPRLRQPMSVVDLCFFVAEHDDHHVATIEALAASYGGAPVYALDLLNAVADATPRLLAMDAGDTSRRPAANKWSPREIVGHLIDSASNNHQRFVRARFQDDLLFAGYAQDTWVEAQRYQDAPWEDLIALWSAFNRHLARVMIGTPDAIRLQPRPRHNLDALAYKPVAAAEPATLDYFMADYVAHLRHHLNQIPGL